MAALDKLLSQLREEYLDQALAGSPPGDDFWPLREQAVVAEIIRQFFNLKAREAVNPDEAAKINDQQDFDGHGQKLVEHAIWMTHTLLKQIPYVGQEEYRDASTAGVPPA